jgi:carbonic anhydrase
VPANEIIGLLPGEVFVHRNVANVVVHTDLNCLSVIQFAVDVLKVKHIMVVGHYGCGGVNAAMRRDRVGLVDLWLRHVQDVHVKHVGRVDLLPPDMRHDRLCELNTIEQVVNVCQTIVVQDAWKRGQRLTVQLGVRPQGRPDPRPGHQREPARRLMPRYRSPRRPRELRPPRCPP